MLNSSIVGASRGLWAGSVMHHTSLVCHTPNPYAAASPMRIQLSVYADMGLGDVGTAAIHGHADAV